MLNKSKIIFLIIIFILSFAIICFLLLGKKQIGRLLDKTNLTNDSYIVQIDDKLIDDIYVYWLGENSTREYDKMLIYHRSLQSEIPPSYGANKLVIMYKGNIYDKIGVWKEYAYSRYTYYININKVNNILIIDWKIKNWYDPNIMKGSDSIIIE